MIISFQRTDAILFKGFFHVYLNTTFTCQIDWVFSEGTVFFVQNCLFIFPICSGSCVFGNLHQLPVKGTHAICLTWKTEPSNWLQLNFINFHRMRTVEYVSNFFYRVVTLQRSTITSTERTNDYSHQ